MTLPSNSSMGHHPNNTVAQFTTALSQNIELDGDWEVGISEICIPSNWYNVTTEMSQIAVNLNEVRIPEGFYSSAKNILEKIVELIKENEQMLEPRFEYVGRIRDEHWMTSLPAGKIGFLYDTRKDKVGIVVPKNTYLFMTGHIAEMLGFDDINLFSTPSDGPAYLLFKAQRQANIQQSLLLAYVYCDIIEPTFVGDTKVQLLRTVNVDTTNRNIVNHIFINPLYVPVLKKHFNSIEINIMTSTGDPVPFASGHSVVTLHFRRTSNPYFLSR